MNVYEKANRRYEAEGDVIDQASEIADSHLAQVICELVTRADCWNKDKKGRTKCDKPCCNRPAGNKLADEINNTLELRHSGRQANEFYVTDAGKSIKFRKKDRED